MLLRIVLPTACLVLVACQSPAQDRSPAQLNGTWVLDPAATEQQFRGSAEWTEADERIVPLVLERLADSRWEITEDVVTVSMRGETRSLRIDARREQAGGCVYEGTIDGQKITLTLSLGDDGRLKILSSVTDDIEHYRWKRASEEGSAGE